MLWFFDRDDESLNLETRYDNDTSEFVAIVRYPDGRENTERFTDVDELRRWLEAFARNLTVQHWSGRSGPIILPYGWERKGYPVRAGPSDAVRWSAEVPVEAITVRRLDGVRKRPGKLRAAQQELGALDERRR